MNSNSKANNQNINTHRQRK